MSKRLFSLSLTIMRRGIRLKIFGEKEIYRIENVVLMVENANFYAELLQNITY